jgi:hypothetical protein
VDASWKWEMARRGESTLICLGEVMLKKHARQERHGHQDSYHEFMALYIKGKNIKGRKGISLIILQLASTSLALLELDNLHMKTWYNSS